MVAYSRLGECGEDQTRARYVTFAGCDRPVTAFAENENWQDEMLNTDWDEFVWQFALNHKQAIAQHEAKYDLWCADNDAGKEPRETY